jgi:hypothetical protein
VFLDKFKIADNLRYTESRYCDVQLRGDIESRALVLRIPRAKRTYIYHNFSDVPTLGSQKIVGLRLYYFEENNNFLMIQYKYKVFKQNFLVVFLETR